jgi:hypothetical protein
MRLLVVYDHPTDLPDYFVARWQAVFKDGEIRTESKGYCFKDLGVLRAWIMQEYPGLVRLDRMPCDQPQIVETWI